MKVSLDDGVVTIVHADCIMLMSHEDAFEMMKQIVRLNRLQPASPPARAKRAKKPPKGAPLYGPPDHFSYVKDLCYQVAREKGRGTAIGIIREYGTQLADVPPEDYDAIIEQCRKVLG